MRRIFPLASAAKHGSRATQRGMGRTCGGRRRRAAHRTVSGKWSDIWSPSPMRNAFVGGGTEARAESETEADGGRPTPTRPMIDWDTVTSPSAAMAYATLVGAGCMTSVNGPRTRAQRFASVAPRRPLEGEPRPVVNVPGAPSAAKLRSPKVNDGAAAHRCLHRVMDELGVGVAEVEVVDRQEGLISSGAKFSSRCLNHSAGDDGAAAEGVVQPAMRGLREEGYHRPRRWGVQIMLRCVCVCRGQASCTQFQLVVCDVGLLQSHDICGGGWPPTCACAMQPMMCRGLGRSK